VTTDRRIAQYLEQNVLGAAPAKLVFLLYDRAIASLREAVAAIEASDIEKRYRANKRAIEIIGHMWSTLDVAQGGEIAANLDRLFPFMLSRLTEVDLRNDPKAAHEVIELLKPLREAWRELARGEAAPEQGRAASGPDSGTREETATRVSA